MALKHRVVHVSKKLWRHIKKHADRIAKALHH